VKTASGLECDAANKQRIDAALYGGNVAVAFWGMRLRGVFWGSAKFLKKI